MRLFLEQFAKNRGMDPLVPETWYNIPRTELDRTRVRTGGGGEWRDGRNAGKGGEEGEKGRREGRKSEGGMRRMGEGDKGGEGGRGKVGWRKIKTDLSN